MKCKAPAYDLKKHFNCIDSCKHISEGKKKENKKMISNTSLQIEASDAFKRV